MPQRRKAIQMLNIDGQTYLTTTEAASQVGYAVQTFHNMRSRLGDKFVRGHELMPGRLFYLEADVKRLAVERGR